MDVNTLHASRQTGGVFRYLLVEPVLLFLIVLFVFHACREQEQQLLLLQERTGILKLN